MNHFFFHYNFTINNKLLCRFYWNKTTANNVRLNIINWSTILNFQKNPHQLIFLLLLHSLSQNYYWSCKNHKNNKKSYRQIDIVGYTKIIHFFNHIFKNGTFLPVTITKTGVSFVSFFTQKAFREPVHWSKFKIIKNKTWAILAYICIGMG